MIVYRKSNVRKAKYGFVASINEGTLIHLSEPCSFMKEHDPSAIIEVPNNMGVCQVRIYTNNAEAAELFYKKYCEV